jgi:LysM repeat protein
MTSGYESRGKRVNRARERHMARQRRGVFIPSDLRGKIPGIQATGRAGFLIRDLVWYIFHTPQILMGIGALMGLMFLLFIATHVLVGRIFPNVWAAGIPLGDMTVEQAATVLKEGWNTQTRIQLVDGDRHWEASPADLGLSLDADKTVEAARNVGLAGIPLGYGVAPVVALDFTAAQNYLLNLTALTDLAPVNAGYQWQDDKLVGIEGQNGRMLDIPRLMQKLVDDPVQIALTQRIDLLMTIIKPDVADPKPLLADAQAVASQPFTINGYDPFTNQSISWSTTRDVLVSWLEAGQDGLGLRDDTFSAFLNAQNQSLNTSPDSPPRYLDEREIKDHIRAAMQNHSPSVNIRIRYRPQTYTVRHGDTATRIARKTGIPLYLIADANPNINFDTELLYPDQIIQLPTRDVTLPDDPIPSKRIVVDLDKQTLTAFENDQVKFDWLISSGISTAPTSPGVFQILTHNDIAAGSSYTLCNSNLECGQWEMYDFMGIYEVVPGLMNGLHGAVLLPNGRYLGGGNVGNPYTFGCIMSQADNGKLLYQWADTGTVVEIISSEFAPQSDLGQLVWEKDRTA